MEAVSNGINKKIHLLSGAFVFLVSCIVYFMTMQPTTSYWDCGEFIACAYTLSVTHPPGNPLFMIIGRIMTLFPFFKEIGVRVNLFSVLISAITVLLTYLIIVQLLRRWRGQAKTWEERLILYAGGVIGSLAFAFTDSFWFNAVEAEVYAFSMFFTAIVVWLALYWEERSEQPNSIIYIFIIFYLFGLALGVHLLNLLVFPFVLLIAYFHHNETVKRFLLLLTVQVVVPMAAYFLLYQYDPSKVSYTEMIQHQAKAGNFLKWTGLIWLFVTMSYIYFKDRKVFAIWWVVPALIVIAYTTYLVIYMRARLHPPINENDPSTVKGMLDYLARKQYGEEDMVLAFLYRKADFWRYQVQMMYTRYFGWQFIGRGVTLDAQDRIVELISFKGLYGLPFFVGVWGMVHHFAKDWKRAVAVLVLFFLTGYAIILYLNQPDPQPRERDYSYVGSFFAFALWVGIGAAAILERIGSLSKKIPLKKIAYAITIVVLIAILPVNLIAYNYHSHDRAGNYVAYDYSYNMLETCEPNAILFTNGDNDTFPLWFLQEVYDIRKDVRIVNLSLLNTHWYIQQLRDIEPKVPMDLNDEQIASLQPIAWETQNVKIAVPDWVQKQLLEKFGKSTDGKISGNITFTVKPTFEAGGQGLRVQDLMILRILSATQWRRPVYFAVTVSSENFAGLSRFFRMDGLAFKILPYVNEQRNIDGQILADNLLKKYLYRNLNNPKVYNDINIVKLLQNYRSAFMQLAQYSIDDGRRQEALAILDAMGEKIPETVIPYNDERTAILVSELYQAAGRSSDDVEARMKHIILGTQKTRNDLFSTVYYLGQSAHKWDRCETMLWQLIQANPNDIPYFDFIRLFRDNGQYDRAQRLLDNLALRYPGDSLLQKEQNDLKRMMAIDSAMSKPVLKK